MTCVKILMVSFMLLLCSGCGPATDVWPDRHHRTPQQMLEDVIRWQQMKNLSARVLGY